VSLILDALNRSRQERDAVPGLATEHLPVDDGEPAPVWQKWLPWVALGMALLIIAVLLLERGTESPAAPSATARGSDKPPTPVQGPRSDTAPAVQPATREGSGTAAEEPASAVVSRGTVATSPGSAPDVVEIAESAGLSNGVGAARGSAGTPTEAEVAALYSRERQVPPQSQPAAPAPDAAPGEAARPSIKEAVEPVGQEQASGEQAVEHGAVEEEAVDIEKMVVRARDEVENARLTEHPAPFIADLSQRAKDGIPTIFYQRHDYRGQSSSVVVLNGKELRVGGRPATGVKVEEILPDSVVLSYQGTEFRLRALNSWVNL
jgi:hypothetical protein